MMRLDVFKREFSLSMGEAYLRKLLSKRPKFSYTEHGYKTLVEVFEGEFMKHKARSGISMFHHVCRFDR